MKIAAARIIEDQSAEEPSTCHWLTEPTLDVLESAVLRLDGVRYPGVGLYLSANSHPDDPPDFDIMGGCGGYNLRAEEQGRILRFFDPLASTALIPIWQSDQGFESPGQEVCRDVQLVLAVTRHYFHTGQLFATFPWRPEEEF